MNGLLLALWRYGCFPSNESGAEPFAVGSLIGKQVGLFARIAFEIEEKLLATSTVDARDELQRTVPHGEPRALAASTAPEKHPCWRRLFSSDVLQNVDAVETSTRGLCDAGGANDRRAQTERGRRVGIFETGGQDVRPAHDVGVRRRFW